MEHEGRAACKKDIRHNAQAVDFGSFIKHTRSERTAGLFTFELLRTSCWFAFARLEAVLVTANPQGYRKTLDESSSENLEMLSQKEPTSPPSGVTSLYLSPRETEENGNRTKQCSTSG
jgi:hypothetical protein